MSHVLRLSVITSAVLSVIATAQAETQTTSPHRNDVMTVYATGTERDSFDAPMMVTVIKNNSPETKTASTANDILRKIPGIGVSGTSRVNGQEIYMRGFDRKGILTLVDNVRQGTDTGHVNGTFLDPALIKQVEIIRGPSALLYGSGAMGGVIAWETVDAKDLLEDGQNSGFRVFSQAATGDHSFGFGGTSFGRTEQLDGLFSFVTKQSGDVRLPETNKTLEVGSKLSFDDVMTQGDTLQLGSTYFTTKAKNYIVAEGRYEKKYNFREGIFQWFPHEIFYANIPSASIHGLDSFISYKNHWFDLNINYNQTTGTEDNTGHSLSSIRPETLSVRFNAPIATTGINLGWIGEFAAKTQLQGSDKYKLQQHKSQHGVDRKHREVIQYAGYSLHDFYVNYQADQFIKGLSTTLTLKNAFDRQYVSSMGVPQEGRNFYFNVSYQW